MLSATSQRPAPGVRRPPGPSVWRHLDVILVVSVLLIAAFGALMVFTATRVALETEGLSSATYLKKQVLFIVLGIGVMFGVASIDYRRFRDWAPALYGLSLLLLVAVFAVGSRVSGAQAWFQVGPYQFEPSEFAKVALIIGLAAYASSFKGRLPGRALIVVLLLSMIPFALVYKQPDLGTALVLLAVLIAVLAIAGARLRHIGILVLIGIIGMTAVVELGVLKAYQKDRLISFASASEQVSPKLLETDAGKNIYNVVESKTAISHGGVFGQGIGNGSQTNLSDVPEQQTDFIFSAAGEQVGLIGCVLLLGLFLLILWRVWLAATLSRDLFGTLLCVGVLAMLAFQIFENIGMTMGIMPVAGIPLPWMSYGGSAVLVEFAAVGLVLNVRMRRFT